MNILLISECSKQALIETRRVLDQFAERKGQRTWQTPITLEGLKTLRMLLKKTARKNTAVACYWIRAKNQTELLWIVGNRRKFNLEGTVPTNMTQRDILRSQDENNFNSIHTSAILAGLAGLFHDFGKANDLFQDKLKPNSKSLNFEAYRHEWLSLLLFAEFVKDQGKSTPEQVVYLSDQEWLTRLATLSTKSPDILEKQLTEKKTFNFYQLPPIAQCVAWLILSHHRLPKKLNSDQSLNSVEHWLEQLGVEWNALNHENFKDDKKLLKNFTFKVGTPIRSKTWQNKAKEIAKRALKLHNLNEYADLKMAFPLHIARLALMLSDHSYSADQPHPHWQDPKYKAMANTDRVTKQYKQHLDEHCIGVAHNAYLLALTLPKLRQSMPAITQHKDFKRRSKNDKFRWQDKAYDCAYSIAEQSQEQGFFGINMASTGKGKTFANARICYALSNPLLGCRFSVALGLRTLTLQTGDALQQRLHLDDDDVAVQIGSQEIKALFEQQQKTQTEYDDKNTGSESEQHFAEHYYVRYEGEIENNYLNRWLKNQNRMLKLVSSPISVSTIDHLIPASEGTSGGQQIAPMLRLLTSDLVLDEPDDFSLEDLPALGRLVYFAGLLGSRVLLSSATLPPYLVLQLFASYYTGRQEFNLVTGRKSETEICCAWFDEFSSQTINCDLKKFRDQHLQFIQKRTENLNKVNLNLHLGNWLTVNHITKKNLYPELANTLYQGIIQLAKQHCTVANQDRYQGKSISTGIIRIANINPLVALAKELFKIPAPENTRIHYCIYHSQHPLATRSAIENQLDALLQRDRQNPQDIFEKDLVVERLQQFPEQHHIFVVLATPVAEVGRDHDYDWAIIEPSSMRSIIQLSGRIQRHRQLPPQQDNILILNKNIRAIKGNDLSYIKPGFESKEVKLNNHDLSQSNLAQYFQPINSIPRITAIRSITDQGLIGIEHKALENHLSYYLRNWWQSDLSHLFAEFQKQTKFRQSRPSQSYIVDLLDDQLQLKVWEPAYQEWIESSIDLTYQDKSKLPLAKNISIWGSTTLEQEIEQLADQFNLSLEETYLRFAQISLPEGNYAWHYHPDLGFYREEK